LNAFVKNRLLPSLVWVAPLLIVPGIIAWSVVSKRTGDGGGGGDATRQSRASVPPRAASSASAGGYAEYAGSASCKTCHAEAYDAHVHTPHFVTSAPAERPHVKASFEPGKSLVRLDGDLAVRMSERDGRFFQDVTAGGAAGPSYPLGMVIGSGKRGQTYLHWDGDRLFQLPASYLTREEAWINSPGFPRDTVRVDRPIMPECLQCHATYVEKTSPAALNAYDRSRVMYGVDCERCHGPAADHVAFHKAHPEEKEPRHVTRIADLTRQQRLDVCAQCHSGVRESSRKPFAFRPGDSIAEASLLEYQPADLTQLDVHSNQSGLLASSTCFTASGTMTCTTCHAPHAMERDELVHSKTCLTCHKTAESCKLSHSTPVAALTNCVECHMPELPSRNLLVQNTGGGGQEPLNFRTHRIAVYKEQSTRILDMILAPKSP
jgi:hypothetical protein